MTIASVSIFVVCVIVARLASLCIPAFRSRVAGWTAWSALFLGHAGALTATAFLARSANGAAWRVVVLALFLAGSWSLLHLPRAERALRRALGLRTPRRVRLPTRRPRHRPRPARSAHPSRSASHVQPQAES